MPIVRIDITGPKPAEYRRALLDSARAAAVGALGVPDDRVTVRVIETPAENVGVPSCRSDRYTVVEVLMYEGRSDELKQALFAALRENFSASPGIEPEEVTISLNEAAKGDLDAPVPGTR